MVLYSMALVRPKSMSELVYYTRRAIGKGKAEVWVFKGKCKCGKVMSKPTLRAKEYVCDCGNSEPADAYEDKLTANVSYTCPKCGQSAEKQVPFQRKKVKLIDEETGKQTTADALQFTCDKCNEKINVTKKMKSLK